jgi:putative ABC transport system substrate-binding protein
MAFGATMRRRDFIGLIGGVAAWPLAADAREPSLVGVLEPWSPAASVPYLAALREGLAQQGFVDRRDFVIEYRSAEGDTDRLASLAAELVQRPVAVIVASAIRAALAAKAATTRIPIVFATANDPVKFGLVASLNRPGGNATGVSWLTAQLGEKRLGLLHEVVPEAATIGILVNPNNANAAENVSRAEAAATSLKLRTVVVNVPHGAALEAGFAKLVASGASAILLLNDPLFVDLRTSILALAARHRLPAMYGGRAYPEDGGLMSYGASVPEAYRQVGMLTARILRGEKPADLPVVQSATFEFVINLGTAKALGLAIPPGVLALADQVIE